MDIQSTRKILIWQIYGNFHNGVREYVSVWTSAKYGPNYWKTVDMMWAWSVGETNNDKDNFTHQTLPRMTIKAFKVGYKWLHYGNLRIPLPVNSRYCPSVHCNDVIMGAMTSQITSFTIVYSTIYSGADQRKYQSSASLAFVRGFTGDKWIPLTNGQ